MSDQPNMGYQNWQSEFLWVRALIVLSIFLHYSSLHID
ncbi:MAG TPA: DUF6766 family protein [Roseiflexaceae bacterium]|nr:DUF6766 family protein [Roseiflexaceae bacterium]